MHLRITTIICVKTEVSDSIVRAVINKEDKQAHLV